MEKIQVTSCRLCHDRGSYMSKAIKWSKIIAWIGIILNIALLITIYILYNDYLDASFTENVLNGLYPIAFIAQAMMYGGIIVKAILEYKLGVKTTRKDLIIVSVVIVVVVIYYIAKLKFL